MPRLPVEGETVLGEHGAAGMGGKGANQAVALSRLEHTVRMVARVGSDHWSELVVGQMEQECVELLDVPPVPGPTGLAVVLRGAAGESTIVVAAGANGLLTAAHVQRHRDALEAADAVLVQAEIPDQALTATAEMTRGRLVVNPAPARPLPLALLQRADLLVPNRLELIQMCELATGRSISRPPSDDYGGLARLARDLPGEAVVVVTLGYDGCLVVEGDAVEHVTGEAVDVVDTTGAGDAFCAALTHRWLAVPTYSMRQRSPTSPPPGLSATSERCAHFLAWPIWGLRRSTGHALGRSGRNDLAGFPPYTGGDRHRRRDRRCPGSAVLHGHPVP